MLPVLTGRMPKSEAWRKGRMSLRPSNHDTRISASVLSGPGAIAIDLPQHSKPRTNAKRSKSKINQIETEISKLEKTSADLSRDSGNPKIAGDYAKLKQVTDRIAETDGSIKNLYEEWESLSASLNE